MNWPFIIIRSFCNIAHNILIIIPHNTPFYEVHLDINTATFNFFFIDISPLYPFSSLYFEQSYVPHSLHKVSFYHRHLIVPASYLILVSAFELECLDNLHLL